jgi:hypothetical protein
MERRHWDETQRQLHTARINARENARLEHGLLPQPVLRDPRLRVSARCWAGWPRSRRTSPPPGRRPCTR